MKVRNLSASLGRTLVATGAVMATASASADVVVHNNGFSGSNQALPGAPNYASNAASNGVNWDVTTGAWGFVGAPDIALTWTATGTGFQTYTGWDGRGNVIQLDSNSGGGLFDITFSPNADRAVHIKSFELDAWVGGGDHEVQWSILDNADNQLSGGTWTRDNVGGRDAISPAFTGNLGQELTLRFQTVSGAPSYLALDNLTFAQAIPEPTSAALLCGLGLGAIAMRRRRT